MNNTYLLFYAWMYDIESHLSHIRVDYNWNKKITNRSLILASSLILIYEIR